MMPGFVKGQVKILRYLMTCVSCVLNDVTLVNLAPNDIHTLGQNTKNDVQTAGS